MENDPKTRPPDEPPPLKEAPKFHWLRKAFGDEESRMLGQASAVGLTFAVAIVLGLAGGWWLDKKLDSAPWLLLLGLLCGIAAGFLNLFRFSARLDRLGRRQAENKKKRLAEAFAKSRSRSRK